MDRGALARLVAFVVSFVGAACAPPPPPTGCVGDTCVCQGGQLCELECPVSGCSADCSQVSACEAACGDACDLSCHDAANCELACGHDCAASCESTSNCEIECGERCQVECRSLMHCGVTMISGEVMCESVASCDVECLLGDGTRVKAEDCGGGIRRCPSC